MVGGEAGQTHVTFIRLLVHHTIFVVKNSKDLICVTINKQNYSNIPK